MTNSSFSKKIKIKFDEVSSRQINQIELFRKVDKFNDYPSIIAVDLNNTQFSETYKILSRKKK